MSKAPSYQFTYDLCPPHERKPKPSKDQKIRFGQMRTDHMFNCEYDTLQKKWVNPRIESLHNFSFPADALVFHYGQQIFEGMKAYRNPGSENGYLLFRPEMNAKRFARSAEIMGMEPVPVGLFLQAIHGIVATEQAWIPANPDTLYIRPMLIPLDEGVYARPSVNYRFSVFVTPVQEYFSGGVGVLLAVERERTRACIGGVGEAKCGGNYAASMSALEKAKKSGADQVLFLDSSERRFVEEAGGMNVFFVYGQRLVTPALSGSILHGVTRDSLMHLARQRGWTVEESHVDINTVLEDARSGKLTECFLCGTAAVISPVRAFLDRGQEILIRAESASGVAQALRKELVDIQTGKADGPAGWSVTGEGNSSRG